MNKVILIISIILIIFGFSFGIFLGKNMDSKTNTNSENSASERQQQMEGLINSPLLASASFGMSGKVTKIEDRIVTIENNGNSFSAKIDSDAKISSVTISTVSTSTIPMPQDASFDSIKIGDIVTIMMSGSMEKNFIMGGKNVTIVIIQQN
jgi:hypothetical protein